MVKDGIVLGKRYAVLSKIGAGGMADVYKGRDQMLNRYVAIKVLKKQYKEDENFVRKFRSEAQAAAGLMHPNIVNVYDVGEDRGLNYMVMELVEGITLKEYIERKGRLSHKETISIAIQMCSGIGAAHASGIIHRDIKPQNIIISKDGKVKVTDFGIAKAVTSNTVSTNAMGSVHYTSPEQARGGFSDQRSDIYSIGITLFEMVTGQVPFDGETTVEVAMKHLQQEITPPSELVPDIPYSLEQIILKCTQKSVDRRYASMSEVIEDLKHSLLDPNGNFVTVTPLAQHAQTVMLSKDELEAIREGRSGYATPQKDTYEDEDEDEDDEDEYDEEYDDEDDDDDEGEVSSKLEKAMTIGGFIIGAIIICILIFFIARAAGLVNIGGSANKDDAQQTEQEEIDDTVDENGQVSVPKLTSMTEENALSVLEQLGLKGNKIGESSSSEYKAGTIMSQETEAGTKVDQGTVINYVVSTGTDAPTIPSIIGKSQSEAEALIKALGLNTEIQQDYSDTVAIGKVISVDPGEGTQVSAGSTITLVVSLGEENKQVEVPNVIGQDEATAKKTLNDQGLQVNVETTTDASGNVAEGCVANQSVAAGTSVDPGSTITLQVYHAPSVPAESENGGTADSGSWTCNVKLDQPSNYTGGPVQLTLVQNIDGQNVETVILDGQTITFPYTLTIAGADGVDTGTVYLREMVDGEYVKRGQYSNVPFKQS